jgi:hypothetical protein
MSKKRTGTENEEWRRESQKCWLPSWIERHWIGPKEVVIECRLSIDPLLWIKGQHLIQEVKSFFRETKEDDEVVEVSEVSE